jgi:hypothetical protein
VRDRPALYVFGKLCVARIYVSSNFTIHEEL